LSSEQGQPLQSAAAKPERRQLFISYSHRDGEWVERLRRMIRPLEQRYGLERWDDSRIQAGGLWKQEIEQALASASVALLLVSADFLASDFVTLSELPRLFLAAKQEGLRILWLPLRPSLWKHIPEIEQYQAVIPPGRTLAEMAEVEQERVFVQIAELILSTFQEQEESRARLRKQEEKRLAREREALERQAEQERLAREVEERRRQEAERLEAERLGREQEALERQAEQERLAREQRQQEQRQAREQAEIQARAEAERWKAEAERLARVNQDLERRAEQEQAAQKRWHSANNDRQEKLQRYELEFRRAINAQYPLDTYVIDGLSRFQQQLELSDQDVAQIKESLMAAKQAEYERKQAEQQQPQRQEAGKTVLGQAESRASEQKEPQRKQAQNLVQEPQISQVPTPSLRPPSLRPLPLRSLSRRQLLITAATAVPVVALGVNALKQQQNRAELASYSVNTGWLVRQGKRWEKKTKPIEVQAYQQKLAPAVVLTMVEISAGTFQMGSPPGEEGRDWYALLNNDLKQGLGVEGRDVEAQSRITVPAFRIGRFPITQAQWKVVAGFEKLERELNADPSYFKGPERPVEQVSWHDAIEFCRRLSKHTGRNYTLPSEAQWEYACRAGTTTPFHFGETLITELANYDGNYIYGQGLKGTYREQTTNVGSFPANAWGLQDMHGNVWEWCLDRWHPSLAKAPTDGSAWQEPASDLAKDYQDRRLLRGGSWVFDPGICRSAYRLNGLPGLQLNDVGFRVCCLPQGSFLYS
jgi:formylglycine-generating enzyme required for sulfatase activity